ncbi:hypothetical protein LX97_01129 [Nonlabens dokdonensis]|uniref:Lipoprotein n=2 Tax=Nonlabens dokdonensis TaxID=328515 RepID=L7WC45_NONDD|nr:DUF6252 family protein [Nonlabens dokdonensis]AGC76463.1 hypothetical protein DDD_1336 [Nonlabens dokdonensis DSW-6]PZX44120.1 hypothetical protein LX97_01129 [Nonlabens dokdonensis]
MKYLFDYLSFRASEARARYGISLILIAILFSISSCDSDDDNPQDPVSQLPPETMTGANTFGALLDGEPFIPSGGTNPLDCVYQLINGERFFNLQGNKRNENFNLIRLSLSTNAKELEEGEAYQLIDNSVGNAFARYSFSTNATFTNQSSSGVLRITKLDLNAQIVSGTFSFDIIDFEGNLREIRNGRFDMRFTQ